MTRTPFHRCILILGAALSAPLLTAEPEKTRDFEIRWKALGLDRQELPAGKNPVLALEAPFKDFLERTREDFKTNLNRVPRFSDYQLDKTTLQLSRDLQKQALGIMARGPGQLPLELDPEGFNVFSFYQLVRANSALAGEALIDGDPPAAAAHLALNLQAVEYIFRSEPNLMAYGYATYLRKSTFDDLFELYRQAQDPKLLDTISTLRRKYAFKKEHLESALRNDLRSSTSTISRRFREWIRDQHAKYPEFWKTTSTEPLASCSLEQLLALPYDLEATLHRGLDDFESALQWVRSGNPLASFPNLRTGPGEEKPLASYQKAPNGLYEIFDDCGDPGPMTVALFSIQLHDAFIEAAIAWLRAEADGIKVESLQELVPKYLEKVPIDPCDGKPLRSFSQRRVLYSVGTNLKDEKGISDEPPHQYGPSPHEPAFVIP